MNFINISWLMCSSREISGGLIFSLLYLFLVKSLSTYHVLILLHLHPPHTHFFIFSLAFHHFLCFFHLSSRIAPFNSLLLLFVFVGSHSQSASYYFYCTFYLDNHVFIGKLFFQSYIIPFFLKCKIPNPSESEK